jgi:DNA-binding CsgD family transcriptional regulator
MVIVAAPAFVGRRSELRSLHDAFARASAGRSQVVLVEGDSGIGKTTLVERFLTEVEPTLALRGSGEESESLLPFAVADQLLRSDGGDSQALRAEGHIAVGLELLARINSGAQEDQASVVVVDDAQLADAASMRTVLFAARRLLASRALIVVITSGTSEAGWRKLAAGATGRTLRVGPLEPSDVAELGLSLGVEMTADAARRLWDHTGGSPLYAEAVLRELPADSSWQHEPRPLPVPDSYAQLIRRRLVDCDPEALPVIEAAAVLGARAPLHAVIELAGLGDRLEALDLAASTGIVRVEDRAGMAVVVFAHSLARAAIYQALPTTRRSTLNAAAAGIVHDDEAALRHRVEAATIANRGLLADLENHAHDGVARGAWSDSVTSLIAASRLSASPSDRERLALEAIEAMLYSGDGAAARRLVEQTGFADGPRRDSVLAYLAMIADDVDGAERMLRRAWERRALADRRLAATIAQRSAFLATSRLRGHEALRWARRAEAIAPDDPANGLLVAPSLALGFSFTGSREAAHAALDRWLEDPSAPPHAVGFVLLALKGHLLVADGDLAAARTAFETSAREGRERGLLVVAALSLSGLSRTEYLAGDWDSAVVASEQAVALAVESEDRWLIARAHWSATDVAAARGDWQVAEAHVRAIHEQSPRFERQMAVHAIATATLADAQDRPQDVLDALAPLDAIEPREGVEDQALFPWHHLKAHALIGVADLEAAERFLAERGAAGASPLLAARLAHARGRLHVARHDLERAETSLREALAIAEPLAMPYEQGVIELSHGQVLRRAGERRAAATALLAAHGRFAELGAAQALRQCETELAACGLAPATRKARDYTALTPQELAVARLVVSGMANREVSEALMLSTKTVEFHLSHIYAKLGVRTRSDLRARARARELSL